MVTLVTNIVAYIGLQLSKKTVFATAAVAAFFALTAACVLVIKAAAVGILYTLPGWMSAGIGMLLPYNTAACIGALMSAKTAVLIYRYHVENLKLVSYIT
jgi:hypothetical protein